jgi:NAD(P)-dependent dehydrogenase (short-subunit alcohol dehydrogenase family)
MERSFYFMRSERMGALDGKVAIVTGATSGIGAEIARLFAAEGANVVIAARRREPGEELARDIGGFFHATDVTLEPEIAALVAGTVERFGGLDVLVNNAGAAGRLGTIAEIDTDRFWETYRLHVGGVLLGMKHAAPVMIEHRAGSIVNVASINARQGGWAGLDYSSAKAAVLQLTRSAAIELGAHGVRVNSISPGPILTGIFGKGAGMDPAAADASASALEPAFLDALENYQPIRRAGSAELVAPAALWLASDGSSFVTGQDIAIDGGITAGRPASVGAAERALLADAFVRLAAPAGVA